ncbi:MAG: molecular chaperone GrpE (heat shock protein) [Maribacter sp.]|jgi:molecular chaperone GrpE (heat shock protein)
MVETIDKIRQQVSKLLIKIAELSRSLKKKGEEHTQFLEKLALKIIERKDILETIENPTNNTKAEIDNLDNLLKELDVTILSAPLDKLADFIKIVATQKEPKRSNGVIIDVSKKGYLRNDELLRPTHVIIVKND